MGLKIAECRRDTDISLPHATPDNSRHRQHCRPVQAVTVGPDGLPRISGVTEIAVGDSRVVYLYGQGAQDPALDAREQFLSALDLVERLLRDAGGHPTHILSTRINLLRAEDYGSVMSAWDGWSASRQVTARPRISMRAPADGWLGDIDVVAAFSRTKFERGSRTD